MNPSPHGPVSLIRSRPRFDIKTTTNSKSLQANKFPLSIARAGRPPECFWHGTETVPCLPPAQPHRLFPRRIYRTPASSAKAGWTLA